MNPSTFTAQNAAWKLMLLSVALCSIQLTSASTTNVALSEEKIRLSEQGMLKYSSLSEGEKADLFEKYEKQCNWKVRGDNMSHISTHIHSLETLLNQTKTTETPFSA